MWKEGFLWLNNSTAFGLVHLDLALILDWQPNK